MEAEPRLVETCPAAGGKVTVEFLCDPYHEDPAPARVREEHGYMSLPLLVRPNTRLPMGARDDRPDYDYEDGVAVRKFEVKET